MRYVYATLALFVFVCGQATAQDMYVEVYDLLQAKCSSCHGHATYATSGGGLDLEGSGATVADKRADVFDRLTFGTPNNATAADKQDALVYPGHPYRSFLFRKINHLSGDVPLEPGEGALMPTTGSLSDKEAELVRQWILFGAPETGMPVDLAPMEDFYDNGGITSVTTVPAPPPEDEGFQIHLGPFFLEPGGEVEYLSKFETRLEETIEITQLQTEMGTYSHHFIVYEFVDMSTGQPQDASAVPYGMRNNIEFDDKGFILTEQYSNTLDLPEGTAFEWQEDLVLDLNTHYINYSDDQPLQCEVYLNVRTQNAGRATQIMETQLIPNTNIPIPNDGEEHSFEQDLSLPGLNIDMFMWAMVAHTHQWGKDFNIYMRNEDGTFGDQIYDGGCANGIPGCAVEEFDYQHLPMRFFDPFKRVVLDEGVVAEATYVNTGPNPVDWGLTSDDEMMLFVVMFTQDTAGLSGPNGWTSVREAMREIQPAGIWPNPASTQVTIDVGEPIGADATAQFIDGSGRVVMDRAVQPSGAQRGRIALGDDLPEGFYLVRITNDGRSFAGKVLVTR